METIISADKERKSMENPKLIGNKSSGYNYKYTSLGDLVLAGVELPPMRVAVLVDGEQMPILGKDGNPIEYIEALLPNINSEGKKIGEEWIRGARIVVPSGNKMNEAQAYGSALTYARRYTALTILGIACDDDNKIESHSEQDIKSNEDRNKEELEELYNKAGGKDFEKWFKDSTKNGFTDKAYMQMKASCIKQINKLAEGDKA